MSERVAIVACGDYGEEHVDRAVDEAVELIGGWEGIGLLGGRVYLKPNLAGPFSPERCVTTHPALVRSVLRILGRRGCDLMLGDGPSGPADPAYRRFVYERTGMEAVARELAIPLDLDPEPVDVTVRNPRLIRRLTLMKSMASSPDLVNLPKLKTHLFARMTGAVKNLYGAVHGVMKVAHHSQFREPQDFAALLLDLLGCLRPRLNIVDAVMGMEGNGPTWGRPRPVGCVVAGRDALAVDHVLCRMMGFPVHAVPLFRIAQPPEVEVLGMPLEEARPRGFLLPHPNTVEDGLEAIRWVPRRLRDSFSRHVLPRPKMVSRECTGCGTCLRSCPARAIGLEEGKAAVKDDRCIRCWCCQEVCPHGAVTLTRTWLGRLLLKV